MLLKNLSRKKLENTNIYTYRLVDDIVANYGWSIPLTFLQQTVKQLEVIWKVVLLEVFNLLNVSIALIKKPVNWFAVQINWLVSIWGQHWHLIG